MTSQVASAYAPGARAVGLAVIWAVIGGSKLGSDLALQVVGLFELTLAASLLPPSGRKLASIVSFVVSGVFLVVTVWRWIVLADPAECGCFGNWRPPFRGHLLITCGLGMASIAVALDAWRGVPGCPARA